MRKFLRVCKPFYKINSFFIRSEVNAGYIAYGILFLLSIIFYVYGCFLNFWEWGHWMKFLFNTTVYVMFAAFGMVIFAGVVVLVFRLLYLITMPCYYLYDWAHYRVYKVHIPDPYDEMKEKNQYASFMGLYLYSKYDEHIRKKARKDAYEQALDGMEVANARNVKMAYESGYKHGYSEGLKSIDGSFTQVQKAMATLLIDHEDFTEQELKDRRRLMLSKFHPDANGGKYEAEARQYNEAYELLSSYIKKR